MSLIFQFAAHVAACVLIADVLSGFFHWLEDAYGREDWPLTGELITRPNVVHHHRPRHFTRHSWLTSAAVLIVLVAAGLLLAYLGGFLNWMTWLVALIGVNANEIHKWAHRSPSENGALITRLQQLGLLQSAAHHARHHQNRKNTHYCVVTNYLNPLLDGIRLWDFLEWVVYRLTGVRRRDDTSVRRKEPLPPSNPRAGRKPC